MRIRLPIVLLLLVCMPLAAPASTLSPDTLLEEGMTHLRAGEHEQGIKKLEAARMMRPKDVRVLYQLGMAHYNLGIEKSRVAEIEAAQRLWREAARLIPKKSGNDLMRNTLEDISKRAEGRKQEVLTKLQLERALRKNPEALEEGLKYAVVLRKRGQQDEAANLYLKLAEAHPTDPRPYSEMARLVYSMGRILWAERYYDQALERDPAYLPAQKGRDALYKELEELRVEGYENIVKSSHPK